MSRNSKFLSSILTACLIFIGLPALGDNLDSRLELIAEAQPDECFFGIGDSTPLVDIGDCDREVFENGELLGYEIGIPKTNEAYVWSLTSSRGNLWFGTGANVNCLVGGIYLGASTPSQGDDSVCEYGQSSYLATSGLPPALGDWRPPKIYSVDMAGLTAPLDKTLNLPVADLVRLNQTVGLRAAASLNDSIVYLAGPSFLGGINVFAFSSATGEFLESKYLADYSNIRTIKPFESVLVAGVAKAGGKGALITLDATESDAIVVREVLEVDLGEIAEFEFLDDRIYFGTWPSVGTGELSELLREASTLASRALTELAGEDIAEIDLAPLGVTLGDLELKLDEATENYDYLSLLSFFTDRISQLPGTEGDWDQVKVALVTELRQELPELVTLLNRTAAVVTDREAAVYVGPIVSDDLDFGSPGDYTRIWTASNYEVDPVIAMTYGIGAMKSFQGQLYWGTMHVPYLGLASKSIIHGPPQSQQEAIADLIGSQRASSYYRFDPANLPEVLAPFDPLGIQRPSSYAELLYGDRTLPRFEVTATFGEVLRQWSPQPVSFTVEATYGSAGFGNPFNNYAWSMTEFEGQLLIGTMDWSYLLLPELGSGLEPQDLSPRALIDALFSQLLSQAQGLRSALDQGEPNLPEISERLGTLVSILGLVANQLPDGFPLASQISTAIDDLAALQQALDDVIDPPADTTGLPTKAEVLEALDSLSDQLLQIVSITQAIWTQISSIDPSVARSALTQIATIVSEIDEVIAQLVEESELMAESERDLDPPALELADLVPNLESISTKARALATSIPILFGLSNLVNQLDSLIDDIEAGNLTTAQELNNDGSGGELQGALYAMLDFLESTGGLLLIFAGPTSQLAFGADMFSFGGNDEPAEAVSVNGLGNELNYGLRTMVVDSGRLFVGTANPMNLNAAGGWQLYGTSTFQAQQQTPTPPANSQPEFSPVTGGAQTRQATVSSYDRSGYAGQTLEIRGSDLDLVSGTTIAGTGVFHKMLSTKVLQFQVPVMPVGKHNLELKLFGTTTTLTLSFEVMENQVLTEGISSQKLNAGSFKGFVAIYVKGYQASRLSAKVGKDWVVIQSLKSGFERIVEFTGPGRLIQVRIYIDRKLAATIPVNTK